ncbi:MAG TPA: hypothetical protein VE134_06100, partial [Methanomicrobiales archaeon]|nr:hypothetical protein [Methanomicrobiales archaeon]
MQSMEVKPKDTVKAGSLVLASLTMQFTPAGNETFPSDHTLSFSTGLTKAKWKFEIVIDEVTSQVVEKSGSSATLDGFVLSYPKNRSLKVRVNLEGTAPTNTGAESLVVTRIQ